MENIKKIESAKVARKYFLISWITNIIFLLISLTQIFFGKLSLFALVLLTIVEILNAIVLFYFTKELSATNDKTAYQIIKSERPILFIPLFLLVLLIIILFILNYIF